MDSLSQMLEEELTEAVEVKNPKSLHRYIVLLSENLVGKRQHSEEYSSLHSDLKEIIAITRERFEAVDKRFEAVDKHFEAMDKRFETVDKRFETVDKRFEDMQRQMDARFQAVDKRFDDMNRRFSGLTWLISTGFVVVNLLIIVFKFFYP